MRRYCGLKDRHDGPVIVFQHWFGSLMEVGYAE